MGLKGILSLLGKAGKNLFSPKTEPLGPWSPSPKTQVRNMGVRKSWMADKKQRTMYNESMEAAKKEVDKLIKQGVVDKNRKIETYQRMEQALLREYDKINLPKSNFQKLSTEITERSKASLIENLGQKAVWAALGIGGAAGYGIGKNEEAIKEMLETVQLPTDVAPVEEATQTGSTFREKMESGQWGPDLANKLMDIISPIPRQD